jgi:hypothetical protein
MLRALAVLLARAPVTACLVLGGASSALAQPAPSVPPASTATFLTRSDAYLSWAVLKSGDPRFSWNARLGFDLDLVDYKAGRFNLAAESESVLGSERRIFDLTFGNYMVEASSTYRVRKAEIAAVFHHISRHLSDRDNLATIAWNVLQVRATRRFAVGASTLSAQVEAGRVLQHTYVDYVWTSDLRLSLQRPVNERLALFGGASGGLIGVNRQKLDRDRQYGARVEAGVHINGSAGAVELFASYERRIDAYPLDRHRSRWFAAGFRLMSK